MVYGNGNYGYGGGYGNSYGGSESYGGGASSYGGSRSGSYGGGYEGGRSSGRDERHEEPKHSRLFVIGGKGVEEGVVKEAFSNFGEVEYVTVKTDRATNKPKGMSYIKFAKTSAAANAMEAMNGQTIGNDPRPIKVVVAGSKSAAQTGPGQDVTPTRLFLVVPKTMDVDELKSIFGAYGDVEHASLVFDKNTQAPKGLAFVNYHRFSHAARAIEECDSSYRAVFATPKEERNKQRDGDVGSTGGGNAMMGQMAQSIGNCCRLKVLFNPSVSKDMFWALFNMVPGLVSCDLVDMTNEGGISSVVYNNPQSAAHALERINGFEYPTGATLQIKMDDEGMGIGGGRGMGGGMAMSGTMGGSMGAGTGANVPGHVQSLISTIKEATEALKGSGFGAMIGDAMPVTGSGGIGNGGGFGNGMSGMGVSDAQKVCSAKLPDRQPILAENTRCEERLFFVLKDARDIPNPEIITDVFCRFGNLIDAVCLRGKKCGYARFGNKASADAVMRELNGEDLLGSRMKIEIADEERGARKRRID